MIKVYDSESKSNQKNQMILRHLIKENFLSFQKRQKLLHKYYFLMFNQHDKIKIKYKIVLIFFINSI